MAMRDALLPEFDHEMKTTRRVLERVPEGRADWRPHPKSMPLGPLAAHVAEIPGWTIPTLKQTELDFAANGAATARPSTTADLLSAFDEGVAGARAALASATDEDLAVRWTLKANGHELFTLPRALVVRSFVLSHLIHHRAQLGVYLRLNDIPLPGCYGPSADEN